MRHSPSEVDHGVAVEEVDGIEVMKGKIRAATKKEEIRTPPIKKEINLSLVEEEDIGATFVEEDAAPTLQEEARVIIAGRMVMWKANVA